MALARWGFFYNVVDETELDGDIRVGGMVLIDFVEEGVVGIEWEAREAA